MFKNTIFLNKYYLNIKMEEDNYSIKTKDILSPIEKHKLVINSLLTGLINQYKELGNLYEKEEKFMEAIVECYINIIKFEPSNYSILNQIGFCYFKLKKFDLAIEYFNKVIQIKEFDSVYRNIGNCYLNIKKATKNVLFIQFNYSVIVR